MSMIMELYPITPKEAERVLAQPRTVGDLISTVVGRPGFVSLEKSRRGLHFTLSRSALDGNAPLNFLLERGAAVGTIDVGYGPARVIHAEKILEIEDALTHFSNDDFTNNLDTDQMTKDGIYPQIWDEPREELLEEYLSYFAELKKFVSAAAAGHNAVLILLR